MVNGTVTVQVVNTVMQTTVWERFIHLVGAPYFFKDMLWIVFPLIVSLFLMQLYFGRYKTEELGWNTAVGNSLALVFVSVDLFRKIMDYTIGKRFIDAMFDNLGQWMIATAVLIFSMWLLFGEFFHLLPKKLAFLISSSLPTTLIAYIAIVLVYTEVKLDYATLIASIVLSIMLAIVFKMIHIIEPISIKEEE